MSLLRLILILSLFGLGKDAFPQRIPDFQEQVYFSIPKTIYFTGEKIWLSIQIETPAGPTVSRIV